MTASFLTPLTLEYVDGRFWKLTSAFTYHLGAPDGAESVTLPVGFLTDFASVPRLLWPLLPPTGTYGKPAVIHDWLYQKRYVLVEVGFNSHAVQVPRSIDRSEADSVLLEAMWVLGVGSLARWAVYAGVRLGGWITWNRSRRHDAEVSQ